jgi:hypothetical protein
LAIHPWYIRSISPEHPPFNDEITGRSLAPRLDTVTVITEALAYKP